MDRRYPSSEEAGRNTEKDERQDETIRNRHGNVSPFKRRRLSSGMTPRTATMDDPLAPPYIPLGGFGASSPQTAAAPAYYQPRRSPPTRISALIHSPVDQEATSFAFNRSFSSRTLGALSPPRMQQGAEANASGRAADVRSGRSGVSPRPDLPRIATSPSGGSRHLPGHTAWERPERLHRPESDRTPFSESSTARTPHLPADTSSSRSRDARSPTTRITALVDPKLPHGGSLYQAQRDRRHVSIEQMPTTERPERSPTLDVAGNRPYADRHRGTIPPDTVWIALGATTPLDMRRWSENERDLYHRGYSDALKAVRRGIAGVDGQRFSRPVLINGNPADLRTAHDFESATSRRRSSLDLPHMPGHTARLPSERSPRRYQQPRPSMGYPPSQPAHDDPYALPVEPVSPRTTDRTYPRSDLTVHPPFVHPGMPDRTGPHGYSYPPRVPTHPVDHDYITKLPRPPVSHAISGSSIALPQTTGGGSRQLISCYPCRSRKMKCDGHQPCSQCNRRGGVIDCRYAAAVRRRGKGRKLVDGAGDSGTDEADSEQESPDVRWRRRDLPDSAG